MAGRSDEFDFVVIGAGSAGCVVAARLSEDPARRVLLIEAGGKDWNPALRVPLMTGLLLRNRYANWFYHTAPEPNLDGRRIFWPRGKVLGGSSAINGMVYTRGTPFDYDGWAQRGMLEWSFDKVLAAFKKSEHYLGKPSRYHGESGPLPISRPNTPNPLFDAFIAAGRQAGHPQTDDFNGPDQEGFGRYDFTIAKGERWSAARAFLGPARGRANLTITVNAVVSRIVVEKDRAVGVEILENGTARTIRATGEIILSCGAVNSPAVLMRSGIGATEELGRLGIPVVADLKGVGHNLRDHLLVRVEHVCTQPVTMYDTLRLDRAALAAARAVFFKSGPASSFPLEAGAFLKSDPALDVPDLQSHFLPGLSTAALRLPFATATPGKHRGHGFFANIYQLRPESTGTVTLNSRDPNDPPVIRPNYLSSAPDLQVLREGVKILRDVFSQTAFDPYRGVELAPGAAVKSDAQIEAWIRRTADTVFHPVGSCKMGTDPMAVVDPELCVHGIEGLRIADASIMPTMPSSNTHAPSMMIGEQAARFIAGETTTASERAAA